MYKWKILICCSLLCVTSHKCSGQDNLYSSMETPRNINDNTLSNCYQTDTEMKKKVTDKAHEIHSLSVCTCNYSLVVAIFTGTDIYSMYGVILCMEYRSDIICSAWCYKLAPGFIEAMLASYCYMGPTATFHSWTSRYTVCKHYKGYVIFRPIIDWDLSIYV